MCPECDGKGYIARTCPRCKGSGEELSFSYMFVPCLDCGGARKLYYVCPHIQSEVYAGAGN